MWAIFKKIFSFLKKLPSSKDKDKNIFTKNNTQNKDNDCDKFQHCHYCAIHSICIDSENVLENKILNFFFYLTIWEIHFLLLNAFKAFKNSIQIKKSPHMANMTKR